MPLYTLATYLGCALLEACVDEAQIWVVLCLGIHTAGDEVLNGGLNGMHVHPAQK